MEETKVQQILENLRQAFPKYEISSLLTKQRGKKYLIIVKGFDAIDSNIDDWSTKIVYPIWWDMMKILETHEEGICNLRLMFIRDNQFLLHSPDVGCGNVFRNMEKPLFRNVYGYAEHQHYICQCQNINDVLEYLTQTQIRF